MKAGGAIEQAASDDPRRSRESGIVDIMDGQRAPAEASQESHADLGAVGGAGSSSLASSGSEIGDAATTISESSAPLASRRDLEIDINTDDTPAPPEAAARSAEGTASASASADDDAIEVSDDEIEEADPSLSFSRLSQIPGQPLPSAGAPLSSSHIHSGSMLQSLQPPPSSVGVMRSRPPAPPSSRPRPPGSSSLPPPRNLANGSSRPPGVDPWLLANKTLELSHAMARIAELEEQVAFRDARIIDLGESLATARRKLAELESRSRQAAAVASATRPAIAQTDPERPALPETLPVSIEPASIAPASIAPVSIALVSSAPASARDDDESDATPEDGDGSFGADGSAGAAAGLTAHGCMPGSLQDNLQQISGIGPRFEAALRRHGVTRLSQIAAWSDADVRQVAKALKIPKSRIVKGRWVEVAREVIGTRPASE